MEVVTFYFYTILSYTLTPKVAAQRLLAHRLHGNWRNKVRPCGSIDLHTNLYWRTSMNSSKLIVAAAAAISVFGAATVAYAQTTPAESGQRQGTMSQTETQAEMDQRAAQANRDLTNRSSTDGTLNRVDGSGTTDMNRTDGRLDNSERVARADRN
jgi:hypothetical protein